MKKPKIRLSKKALALFGVSSLCVSQSLAIDWPTPPSGEREKGKIGQILHPDVAEFEIGINSLAPAGEFDVRHKVVLGVGASACPADYTLTYDPGQDGAGESDECTADTGMTVTSGDVGIGTLVPTKNLDVVGESNFRDLITTQAGITTGDNIVSDTDSTDSLGTSLVRYLSVFADLFTGERIVLDGVTGANEIAITDNVADGLSITEGTNDLITIDTTDGTEIVEITPNTAISGIALLNNTTSSTDKDTGALVVQGGTGIEENLNVGGNSNLTGTLDVDGITTLNNTTTSSDKDTGALVVEGGAGIEENVNIGGNINVTGTADITNDTTITGVVDITGDTSISGTVDIMAGNVGIGDATPGAALVVGADDAMGSADGVGDVYIQNDLEVDGTIYGTMTGDLNSNVIQMSGATGANKIEITDNVADGLSIQTAGADDLMVFNTTDTSETLTIKPDTNVTGNTDLDGTLNVDGVTTLSNTTTSTDKDTGSLVVQGGAGIEENLNVGGALDVTSTTNLQDDTSITGILDITGSMGIGTATPQTSLQIDATDAMRLPVGTTLQRPSGASELQGQVRYNTDLSRYEGFDGTAWGSLGGSIDIDQDTQIQVEESADEDKIRFDTAGSERVIIDETGKVGIGTSTPATTLDVVGDAQISGDVDLNSTTGSTDKDTGALIVEGGVGIEENTNIGGSLAVTGTTDLTGDTGIEGITTLNNITQSTDKDTGALVVEGGIGLEKNLNLGGDIDFTAANHTIGAGIGANELSIGGATSTVVVPGDLQVQGSATAVNTQNLDVNDQVITVNRNGNTASTIGAGLLIEGDAAATVGYLRVDGADNSLLEVKSPTGNELVLDIDADATLTVNGNTTIDQAVDTLAGPSFDAGLTIDTNTLKVDATSNRVGVGTATPAQTLDVDGTVQVSGDTVLNSTTSSTTKDTGALIVDGGVGIEENTNIGGNLDVTGTATITDNVILNATTTSTTKDTGALVVNGGVGIEENTNIGGNFAVTGTSGLTGDTTIAGVVDITNSTGSTTKDNGALIVDGGAGIEENVNVGNDINAGGNLTVTGTASINTLNLASDTVATPVDGALNLKTWATGDGSAQTRATITAGGNMGIGDTTPGAHLVIGDDTNRGSADGTGDVYVQNDLEVDGTIYGTVSGAISSNRIELLGATGANEIVMTDNVADGLSMETSSGDDMIVFNTTDGSETLTLVPDTTISGAATLSSTLGVDGVTTLNNTTSSTTKDTGALVVEGGVGIEENTNIGGNLDVTGTGTIDGNVTLNATTTSTTKDTGALVVEGGVGIEENTYIGGVLDVTGTGTIDGATTLGSTLEVTGDTTLNATTTSTTKDTGALVVEGGVGIEENLNLGGSIDFTAGSHTIGSSIGANNLTLGGATSTVVVPGDFQVQGAATAVNTTNLDVTDQVITVNKNGNTASTIGAGMLIEGDSAATVGYVRVDGADNSLLEVKSPTGNELVLDVNADATLTITGSGTINQDVDTTSSPSFVATTLTGTTSSTTKDTGALIVDGGVGIEENTNIGGNLDVTGTGTIDGNVTLNATTTSTTKDSGALIVEGGVGIEENTNIGGNLDVTGTGTIDGNVTLNATTTSTTKDTGALVVEGGVGIEENTNIGGTLGVTSTSSFGGDVTITGEVLPSVDNTYSLGSATKQWKDVFVGANSLHIGGQTISNNGGTLEWGGADLSGLWTEDTGDINRVSGNVGIGTATPANKLDVVGNTKLDGILNVTGTSTLANVQVSTDALSAAENSNFTLKTWATADVSAQDRVTILANGNVGIGTTSPGTILVLNSTDALKIPVGTTAQRPTAVQGQIRYNTDQSSFEGYDGASWGSLGGAIDIDQDTQIQVEESADEDKIRFDTAGSERVIIDETGKMGIGTSSPAQALDVVGAIAASGNITSAGLTVDTSTLHVDNTGDRLGVGTTSPLVTLDVNGGIAANLVTKTADYTATALDHTILVNATSGNVTITLPAAATVQHQILVIKRLDSSANTITIDANASETIDGQTTTTLRDQYNAITIQSDGSNWFIL